MNPTFLSLLLLASCAAAPAEGKKAEAGNEPAKAAAPEPAKSLAKEPANPAAQDGAKTPAAPDKAANPDAKKPAEPPKPVEPPKPGENLLKNGSFEEKSGNDLAPGPAGWDPPNDLTTFWEKDDDPAHGFVIRVDTGVLESEAKAREKEMDAAASEKRKPAPARPKTEPGPRDKYGVIGASYGVSLYGEAIPVKPGKAYRLTVDVKGKSGKDFAPKVWVRGLSDLGGRERRLYDFPLTCRLGGEGWRTFSGAFHPTKNTPKVQRMRVMLYAYWPAGEYGFDNVRIVEITAEEYEKARQTERAEIK
ncbi:MAG: hypothetical protein AAB215_09370 [Planctomycetota bacterium]|mgnify:CR=1 FL=1